MYRKSENILNGIAIVLISCIFLPDLTKSGSPSTFKDDETRSIFSAAPKNIFYYFAYGSNMYSRRVHINSPTAINLGVALLKDYRFSFNAHNIIWNGTCAAIFPDQGSIVYGVLYEMEYDYIEKLDEQESVPELYFSLTVPVTLLSNGKEYFARTYQLVENPIGPKMYDLRPTKSYLAVIIKGAEEAGLPRSYINYIKHFNHTDEIHEELEKKLDLQDVQIENVSLSSTEELILCINNLKKKNK